MPFKIVRNDITKMQVDAIVNTANEAPKYSDGVDRQIIRLQYLQEIDKRQENSYCYALVKSKVSNQIKYEDGENTNICLVNKLDKYVCTNRTEAYCLVYI